MNEEFEEYEALVKTLNDPALRAEYARPFDDYRPGFIARFLGNILVTSGNLVYGKHPSYAKFKAVEVIARIPYQSWEVASYTLLTALYSNEKKAMELCKTNAFARMSQDNETMHVVVISQIVCRRHEQGFFRHTLIPLVFAFFYFCATFLLYVFSRKSSLELNYLFECHAYAQYSEFVEREAERLKHTLVTSEFLEFYGRHVHTEYELFESIRNDELIHRNRSIREIHDYTKTK